MDKWLKYDFGTLSIYNTEGDAIKKVEFVGKTEVATLQTSSRTYIAEGYASHNTYKTLGFSWIKTNSRNGKPFFGIGHYTRSNCEVCLLAVRGKPKVVSKYVSSVIISPRRKHSEKPDIVRDKIVELCGDVPRIELFARKRVAGWDSWGREIDSVQEEKEGE